MARRGRGEGSISYREKEGRWVGSIRTGDGGRKYVYGETRQDVQRKLAQVRRDLEEHGQAVGDERQTVGQYMARWLETVRASVKPGTWRCCEIHARLHIGPHLGRHRLSRLTPQHEQLYYAALLAKGLSPTTVEIDHGVLHHALKDAVRLGLIPRNVTEMVTKPRRRTAEMHVWTDAEARRFLEHAATAGGEDGGGGPHRLYALFALALGSGMRLGELLALRWRSMDLQRQTVRVVATVRDVAGGVEYGEPKTRRSRRRITIPQDVADALREHRVRQHRERLELGPAWQDHGLVFCREDGAPLSQHAVSRVAFRRLVRGAGVPAIRFHDLRHTCATILLGRGVNPKVVSELLGHSNIAITLDVYSHVLPDMQQAASEELGRALFG